MINIRQLLVGLTQAIRGADFPNAATLATALDLDLSDARISQTKSKLMLVRDARLKGSGAGVNIACGLTPRREIWLIIENSSTPHRDVKDETFGANQRVIPSKRGAGFGVLFEIDGLTCGYTASSTDSDVDALFCEEPKPASAGIDQKSAR
jgi:hypothetical protein